MRARLGGAGAALPPRGPAGLARWLRGQAPGVGSGALRPPRSQPAAGGAGAVGSRLRASAGVPPPACAGSRSSCLPPWRSRGGSSLLHREKFGHLENRIRPYDCGKREKGNKVPTDKDAIPFAFPLGKAQSCRHSACVMQVLQLEQIQCLLRFCSCKILYVGTASPPFLFPSRVFCVGNTGDDQTAHEALAKASCKHPSVRM